MPSILNKGGCGTAKVQINSFSVINKYLLSPSVFYQFKGNWKKKETAELQISITIWNLYYC